MLDAFRPEIRIKKSPAPFPSSEGSKGAGLNPPKADKYLGLLLLFMITSVPPYRHIVARSFFKGGNMAIQPENISSSAGPVVVAESNIMSEYLPIAEKTTAPIFDSSSDS